MVYALWSCPASQDVWCQCSKQIQKSVCWQKSFLELLAGICAVFEKEVVEEVAVVARRIWQRRNIFIFQGEFKHPNEVLHQSLEALQQL